MWRSCAGRAPSTCGDGRRSDGVLPCREGLMANAPTCWSSKQPLGVLLKEIEALSMLPRTDARDREIQQLRRRVDSMRSDIYATLSPWQRVQLARHPTRPAHARLRRTASSPEFIEIHGDRRFARRPRDRRRHGPLSRRAGAGRRPPEGRRRHEAEDLPQLRLRASPRATARRSRAMKLAEKFERPVIVFVDTPAAYPGIESEERGVAEAIAVQPPGDGRARRPDDRR